MITSPTRSGRAMSRRDASGSANFAAEVICIVIPGSEFAVARFRKQPAVGRFTYEQLAHCRSERVDIGGVHHQAPAAIRDFGNRAIITANARASMPEAFQNGQTEALPHGWIDRERTIPIRFVQYLVGNVTQPFHGSPAFRLPLDHSEDGRPPVRGGTSDEK